MISQFFKPFGLGCLLMTLMAVGCADQPPAPLAATKEPAAVPADPPSAPQSPASGLKPGDNPNRINQLRSLKAIDLKVAGGIVHAWIMDNESRRQEGMMFLEDKEVKENQGMIFVFPEIQVARDHGFWMHNCPMGLDIMFIDMKHRVINIGDGKPENDDNVPALGDYFFVLEMKRGWAKRHHFGAGATIPIPASLKTSE